MMLLWFVIFWLFSMTAYRILMTWVYARTRSVLVAILMHAGYTGSLVVMSPAISMEKGMLWQTAFAVGLWLIVVIVAFSTARLDPKSHLG
jgi:uncharacterized membrane protein YccC